METEFKKTVAEMRRWQKEFFRTRSPQALSESRRLEKKVDKMLEDMEQPGLF